MAPLFTHKVTSKIGGNAVGRALAAPESSKIRICFCVFIVWEWSKGRGRPWAIDNTKISKLAT
jgi:hypothetical protein